MQAEDRTAHGPERDPVCGRELTREQALLSAEVKDRTYFFCSERCRMMFSIRPAWFVERDGAPTRRQAS